MKQYWVKVSWFEISQPLLFSCINKVSVEVKGYTRKSKSVCFNHFIALGNTCVLCFHIDGYELNKNS